MTAAGSSDDYELRTELSAMDLDRIHQWLSTDAYWALGRSRDNIERAAQNSLNFGLFTRGGQQVAYARVLTDRANFAWLCDVYVDRDHRGRGLGGRLMDDVLAGWSPWASVASCSRRGTHTRSTPASASSRLPRPQDWMIRVPTPPQE